MRKLILTCGACGQRMQVPRSAIGRTGLCPACGATVRINSDNTTTAAPKQKGMFGAGANWWQGGGKATDDAKRRFGEAVDLYYSGRFAEALAIFNGLARDFPNNPDIQNGRVQCEKALRRPGAGRRLALEDKSEQVKDAVLDRQTVERIVLEKLVAGESDAIQLQAAEIAAKILGMYDAAQMPPDAQEKANEAGGQEAAGDMEEAANSARAKDTPFTIYAFRDFAADASKEEPSEDGEQTAEDDDVTSPDARRA
ncbi:MAG: hypothetical protein R6V12_07200 [Candidatus Hydrogenedentota bacterium]